MAQMLLSEARTFLQDSMLQTGATGASDSRSDRAIQAAGDRFHAVVQATQRTVETNLTADLAKADLSADSDFDEFIPERLISVSLGYEDTGNWATSTAYVLGDYVANDTAPVKNYVCTVAGTSAGSGGPTGTGAGAAPGGSRCPTLGPSDTSIKKCIFCIILCGGHA